MREWVGVGVGGWWCGRLGVGGGGYFHALFWEILEILDEINKIKRYKDNEKNFKIKN